MKPGQNPAHDSFSALALSEVQNCNNSDPESMECKGNQDTGRRKVFGEHLFRSLLSLNKSYLPNFMLYIICNQDTARRKVFGEHLLFHSLLSLNKSYLSNFMLYLC